MRLIAIVLSVLLISTAAFARCEEPEVDCGDKVNEAWRDLKHSGSLSDAVDNAKRAGEVARECVDCALESIERDYKKLVPSNE